MMRVQELMINAGRVNDSVYRLVRSLLIFKLPAMHAGHYWACEFSEEELLGALRFNKLEHALSYLDLLSRDKLIQTFSGRMFGGLHPSNRFVVSDNQDSFYYYIGNADQLELKVSYIGAQLDPWIISVCNTSLLEGILWSYRCMMKVRYRLKVSELRAPRDVARVISPMALMVGLSYSKLEELIVEQGNIISDVKFDLGSVLETEEYKDYRFYGSTFRIGHLLAGVSSESAEENE
jgi:hypothetical protein